MLGNVAVVGKNKMINNIDRDFLLERYRYILAQKQNLNESTFKVSAVYQALLGAVGIAQFNICQAFFEKKMAANISLVFSSATLIFFLLSSVFVLVLMVSGVRSWIGYRQEEAQIESQVFKKSRALPKVKNLLFWYETYIIFFIVVLSIFAVLLYLYYIFPLF